ncbi:patatin-like phospholipase family protein [Streptacidiphilus sp. ASG 303]|uniref:patatin-like phospholipase family protein n=1 Tax=Streptacidiphilus sp. ASG 303 TaxID=2896847 RepID=UPI001E33DD43|nr:patatin-like phospholipase family protein [Streptacidiphilus sp. ASG 303]MCD0486271.1 patatin-like phospholipase family protein [Streptacidiphilus sp. ASG 303]
MAADVSGIGGPGPDRTPSRSGRAARGAPRRGLVLGGGGMLGAAWTVGALCAVAETAGWDPRGADVVLGTSAGSILGTLLASGVGPGELRDHQQGRVVATGPLVGVEFDYDAAVGGALPPRPRPGIGSPGLLRQTFLHPRDYPFLTMVSAFVPPGRGSVAPIGDLVRALVPSEDGWADRPGLRMVAVDYETGHRVVFGDPDAPAAGVAEAVMASCAIPGWFAPVAVDGRRYIDGGAWSATNADLLAGRGLDEVYVLAPMAVRLRTVVGGPAAAGSGGRRGAPAPHGVLAHLVSRYRRSVTRQLLREARLLREGGTRVRLLAPTLDDLAAMGPNMMDPARRPEVLETALRTCGAVLAATHRG